jgi:predicted ArsR family transcriptional regulator
MQLTRDHILKILKERKRITVDELSAELNLTSATVRHHMDILQREGLIEAPEVKRRSTPGRPQYIYTLTEAAATYFPQNYASLATMLLTQIESRWGKDALDLVLQDLASQMASECPPQPAGENLETRLKLVVEFLNSKGYMTRYAKDETGYYLYVSNCPYLNVSHTNPNICRMDTALISQLLNLTPRQVRHITDDKNACIYQFTDVSTPAMVALTDKP